MRLSAARPRGATGPSSPRPRRPTPASPAPRARASGSSARLLRNRARSGRPVFNVAVAARNGKTSGRLPQAPPADLRRLRRGPLLRAREPAAFAAGGGTPRGRHDLRGHLERQDVLEAPALSDRSGGGARTGLARSPRQHLGLPVHAREESAAPAHDAPDRPAHAEFRWSIAIWSAATTGSSSTAPRRPSTRGAASSAPASASRKTSGRSTCRAGRARRPTPSPR